MSEVSCCIDSISIRVNDLRLEDFFKEYYCYYYHKKAVVYTDKNTNIELFTIRTAKEQFTGILYQYISFNGFKKYHLIRDDLLKVAFNDVIQMLEQNDIQYYLRKIDLSIDFIDVDIVDLFGTQRSNWSGTIKKKPLHLQSNFILDCQTNC